MKKVEWKRLTSLCLTMSMLCSLFTGLAPAAAAEGTGQENPSSELLLELNFDDETVSDSSGTNKSCTPVGEMTYVVGHDGTGKALHLDNSAVYNGGTASDAAQYVVFDDLALGAEDFTVMFWYKAEAHDSETVLFGNKDWNNGNADGLVFTDMADGASMNFAVDGSGRFEIRPRNNTSMTDGNWHHFAGTFDRDGDEIYYIDGEKVDSLSISKCAGKSLDIEGQPYCLGADGAKHFGTYNGDIDEFRIYRGVLSAEELKAITAPSVPEPEKPEVPEPEEPEVPNPDGPVSNKALLKVNFDNNTANDTERNIEGTITGNPEFVPGKSGQCIHIVNPHDIAGETKPAAQYVSYGDQLKLDKNDFSVMFWYKADVHDDKEGAIFSNKDYASGANPGLVFADMAQGLAMNVHAQGGDRHEIRLWNPAGVTDGQWHHIVGTFDRDGEEILYIDGKEQGRVNISDIKDQSMDIESRRYNLGADGLGQCGLENGFIDEFCVYQGVVNPEELADLYIDQKLNALIADCRDLVKTSGMSEEAKQAFTTKIDDIEERAKNASSASDFKALMTELENAKAEFLNPGEVQACFDVMSDTHITNANNESGNYQGMHRAIQNIIKNYPDTMGIFNSGDYTNSGYEDQNRNFFEILSQYDDKVEFTNCLGNHDVRWKPWTEIYERYLRYNAPYMPKEYVDQGKVYHDKWLGPDKDNDGKGDYHFIVMNSEYRTKDKSYFSDEQLAWFREKLAEDNADGSKPVFVFTHEPLKDTIHWSNDWSLGDQDGELKEIMRDYPNTIVFTGHVHNGIDLVRAEQRDWGYAVDIPGFISCDQGQPRGQYGWHVTIYEDRVVLDLYDYINDTFLEDKQQTLWIPNQMAQSNGKILDVDFNDETAADHSGHGHNGTIHGNVEFVDGPSGDKAVHLVNSPDACAGAAEQYIDFGNLNLDKENFTVMFWYKADGSLQQETTMFSNKDWNNGNNDGLVFGDMKQGVLFNIACEGSGRLETSRYPDATDGNWHLITATVDRDGYDLSVDGNTQDYDNAAVEKFYIDGQLVEEKNIDTVKDKSVESGHPYVLGADGLHNLGIENGYFDGLKVYKNALGAAEIRTLVCPFTVAPGGTAAVVTCNPDFLDNNWVAANLTVAYLYLDNENTPEAETRQIPGYPEDNNILIDNLEPNTPYKLRVVTVEKNAAANITDVYELHFTTKAEDGKVKFDLNALQTAVTTAESVDTAHKTTQAATTFLNALDNAKKVLREAQVSDILPTDLTQEKINAAAAAMNKATEAINKAAAPVASTVVPHTGMTATASSDCGQNNAEGANNGAAQNAIDDHNDTYWHNNWKDSNTDHTPHWIQVAFDKPMTLSRVDYLPRQNHTNGHWSDYTMYIIDKDGNETPVIEHGKFENPDSKDKRTITIEPTEAYGVKFFIHDAVGGSGTAAEIDFFTPSSDSNVETVSDITVHFYALVNDELQEVNKLTGLTTYWIDGRQCIDAETLAKAYGAFGFKAEDLKASSSLLLHRDLDKGNFWYAPTVELNGKAYAATINHKESKVEGYPYNEFDVFYQPNQSYKNSSSSKDATQLSQTESFYTVTISDKISYHLTGTNVTVKPEVTGNDYWVCTGADGKEIKAENGTFTIPAIKQAYTLKLVSPVENHTVIFKDFDGKQLGEAQTVKHGEAAVAPTAPTREGYNFIGWDKEFTNVTSDLTVTAKYAPITYTVTIDGNKNTVQHGQKLGDLLPKAPVKEGFTFDKWVDANGNTVTKDTVVKSDLTVTSKWVKNEPVTPDKPVTKYTVRFNANGGHGTMKAVTVKKGDTFTLPACGFTAPEGKQFNGWNMGAVGTKITVNGDVELVAQWIADTKPTPAPDTKPTPTPDTKPIPTPDAKPTPTPETKPTPAPETKPTATPDAKPAPASPAAGNANSPQTGDTTGLLLWASLAIISGGAVLVFQKKRIAHRKQ